MEAMGLLAGRASPQARARLLSAGITADSAKIYSIEDDRPTVLKASPPEFPKVISELVGKARLVHETLGSQLGRPVPLPIDEWEANGVSCALYERFKPISNNRLVRLIQLRKITPLVLNWLRRVAAIDRGVSETAESNLKALAECPYASLRNAAKDALADVREGVFRPRSRLMHGDLWLGNVLLDPSGARDFRIIDWRGSEIDGFPIFDLVKFAESSKLRPSALRVELTAHAKILGCAVQDTRSYLLAALGHIWLNLDQFPPERFAAMGVRNLRSLDAALSA